MVDELLESGCEAMALDRRCEQLESEEHDVHCHAKAAAALPCSAQALAQWPQRSFPLLAAVLAPALTPVLEADPAQPQEHWRENDQGHGPHPRQCFSEVSPASLTCPQWRESSLEG